MLRFEGGFLQLDMVNFGLKHLIPLRRTLLGLVDLSLEALFSCHPFALFTLQDILELMLQLDLLVLGNLCLIDIAIPFLRFLNSKQRLNVFLLLSLVFDIR
jgi:hypothetical protein